jgi:putative MATE family efflux protein
MTLWLNALAGIVVGLGTFFASRWVVSAMGAQPEYLADATLYMQWSSLGIIFQAIPTAVAALTRGSGNTRIPAGYNLVSNFVNVAIGYLLIYGPLGLPHLGVLGAGIAQLIAKAVAMALSLYAMLNNSSLKIRITARSLFRPEFSSLGRLLFIGLPAAGEQTAMRLGLVIFSKLIADLGPVPLAAHTINMNIQGLIFNFGVALGAAATSLTGRSLGQQRPDLAQAYLKETRRIGLVTSIVFVAALVLLPRPISSLFASDDAVVSASAAILWIGAAMVPFQTSQLILCGGLRGAGDTLWPLVATMSGVLFVRVIAAYLCIVTFGFGLAGGWYAFLFDQATRSLVIWLRYLSGKWMYRRI